ncbi:hypothetical protein [Streptosporangium sp. V21-05]|uniref:hypothetical protein n=1 Tax=Streptosporangium sp. V21-05 TaxID=3446115 RepID=UPI003F530E95
MRHDRSHEQLPHRPKITKKSEIQAGTLYFHAETWNSTNQKWQARSACKTCDVWLKEIGACST